MAIRGRRRPEAEIDADRPPDGFGQLWTELAPPDRTEAPVRSGNWLASSASRLAGNANVPQHEAPGAALPGQPDWPRAIESDT
jgi:hypothetical protein